MWDGGEFGGGVDCSGFSGVAHPPSAMHDHLEPQSVTLFGNGTFAGVIS